MLFRRRWRASQCRLRRLPTGDQLPAWRPLEDCHRHVRPIARRVRVSVQRYVLCYFYEPLRSRFHCVSVSAKAQAQILLRLLRLRFKSVESPEVSCVFLVKRLYSAAFLAVRTGWRAISHPTLLISVTVQTEKRVFSFVRCAFCSSQKTQLVLRVPLCLLPCTVMP